MIELIFRTITDNGHLTYGEEVSQLDHVLQCGQLAREDGAPPSLIAAALLHDIGQFLGHAGEAAEKHGFDAHHETLGADFLSQAFPEAVTEPIRMHVLAKRYLCTVEPGYRQTLSRASALSLQLQGGPMSRREAAEFRRQPHFHDAIRLRRYDDEGKRIGWEVPGLLTYRPLLEDLLTT